MAKKVALYVGIIASLVAVLFSSISFNNFTILSVITVSVILSVYNVVFVAMLGLTRGKEGIMDKAGIFTISNTFLIISVLAIWIFKMFNSISDNMGFLYVLCILEILMIICALKCFGKEGKVFGKASVLVVLAWLGVQVLFLAPEIVVILAIPTALLIIGIRMILKAKKSEEGKKKKMILGGALTGVSSLAMVLLFCGISLVNNVASLSGASTQSLNTPMSSLGSVNYSASSSVSSSSMISAFDSLSATSVSSPMANKTIGFSVGGAKDINNFRENIKNDYLPLVTDITHEGLFYDYYFDTGRVDSEDEMFYPSYSYASSNDPLSGEQEHYLSVGLNSNIKESDFMRKKLNLVLVLDISGSMSSQFNSYYYDQDKLGEILENMKDIKDANKSKMQIASESVNILLDQLNDDDKFGLVLFESDASVHTDLTEVAELDINKTKRSILAINERGGTNFDAGYNLGTELLEDCLDIDTDEYENRIIVLTDAMPNIGRTSELMSDIKQNARNNINTSFIGIGVDFNTTFIEEISAVRGANYYSVHSSGEFKERMGEQFEFMVTPLVYDLEMSIDSDNYSIDAVYGTNEAGNATNTIMYVNTLFPSKSDDNGEVKGGIILLKLKKVGKGNEPVELKVTYEDRKGNKHSNVKQIVIPNNDNEVYPNSGIRKAIVLTRYCNLMKNWIMYEKSNNNVFYLDDDTGINEFDFTDKELRMVLSRWERQSDELIVSNKYKETFETFKEYFLNEVQEINDNTLKQEVDVLEYLINY